jgi:hypothetical protein
MTTTTNFLAAKRFYTGTNIPISGFDSPNDRNGRGLFGANADLEIVSRDTLREKFIVPFYEKQMQRLGHPAYQPSAK